MQLVYPRDTSKTKKPTLLAGIVVAVSGLLVVGSCRSVLAAGAKKNSEIVWKIGKRDGLSKEFSVGSRQTVRYIIGKNTLFKDFPASQRGSLYIYKGSGKAHRHPYTIIFNKPTGSVRNYTLVLDLIYNHASPKKLEIDVNGRRGIFPVSYKQKKALNDGQGISILLAKQQIEVPVRSSWLKQANNQLTIIPLGLGSVSYDAIAFKKGELSNGMGSKLYLKPTIFYHKKRDRLIEGGDLQIPFTKRFTHGKATLRLGNHTISTKFKAHGYDFGILTKRLTLPAFNKPERAIINVSLDGKKLRASQNFVPAKKWKFYITPRVHNDVGFTSIQPNVNELDTRNADRVMSILGKYPSYQYNFEDAWLVENYLDGRTNTYREKFYKYAKQGRVANNVFYLNLLTGLCSGEELFRATYEAHKLHEQHGTTFNWASLSDVPTSSWFLPTLLNDIGVKYFTEGSNQTRGPVLQYSHLNEESPFYWEGMNGKKVMMWYARAYFQFFRLIHAGWPNEKKPEYNLLNITLPQFLTRYRRKDYVPDAVMIYGAYLENVVIPRNGGMPLVKKWNRKHAYPKLIMATDADYYHYISRHFKNDLPTYRGGGGAYWADGAGSTARITKIDRHTHQLLPMAETAASLSSIIMPKYRYRASQFAAAWKNVLFTDEHTWGSYQSIAEPDRNVVKRQWKIKRSYAKQANMHTRNMLTRSLNRLSHLVRVKGNILFAYNFQPWKRTDPIRLELNDGQYVIDLKTNKPVEYEVLSKKEGYYKMLFLARNVPPMGYKEYAIRSLKKKPKELYKTRQVSGAVAESPWYKLTIDQKNGGIKSLIDKKTGKQLVDRNGKYSLNEYLYVSGGKGTKIVRGPDQGVPPVHLTVHQPQSAKIIENISTPIGQRIMIETKAKNTPTIRSTYQLYNDIKRIDIKNEVVKDATRLKEAVYFAFPFEAKSPKLAYQIQNGWLRPNKDQLPGADREWFTTQNLVRVKDGNFTTALSTPDAPLITLEHINRGKWPKHLNITNGHVFSYVMNNYWFTNYKARQGGKFKFDYSITSGNKLNREQLAQFDTDTRTPILGYPDMVTHFSAHVQQEGPPPLSSEEGSFIKISNPHLEFVVLKQAEDGKGWILRLRTTTGREGKTKITFPLFDVQKAYLTNGVEKNKKELPVKRHTVIVPYQSNNFTTVRLYLKPGI